MGATESLCCFRREIVARFGSDFICSRLTERCNDCSGFTVTATRLASSIVGSGKASSLTSAIPTISLPSLLWYRKQRSQTRIALRLFLAW